MVHSWNINDNSIPAIQAIDMCLNNNYYNNFDMEWVEARKTTDVSLEEVAATK